MISFTYLMQAEFLKFSETEFICHRRESKIISFVNWTWWADQIYANGGIEIFSIGETII